jgi:hypothetical protein
MTDKGRRRFLPSARGGSTACRLSSSRRWGRLNLLATTNSRMKLGQTATGRYLQVIYVPDEDPESVFVITAHELQGKAKTAYRRRQRRKPR